MTTGDIALYVGLLVSSWAIGFTGGYLLTKFKDALNSIV